MQRFAQTPDCCCQEARLKPGAAAVPDASWDHQGFDQQLVRAVVNDFGTALCSVPKAQSHENLNRNIGVPLSMSFKLSPEALDIGRCLERTILDLYQVGRHNW